MEFRQGGTGFIKIWMNEFEENKTKLSEDAYRKVMVIKVTPRALSDSYILPSTSLDTALVHSSNIANLGR